MRRQNSRKIGDHVIDVAVRILGCNVQRFGKYALGVRN